jgi:DNA-binding MarR family transcriptional regulator
VITAIGTLSRAIDRYRNAFGADRGLTGTEVVALIHLFQEHTASAGEIAARTGLTPGAVTALLDRLERRGYLTRIRPPANRRTLRIELTGPGWALRGAAFDPIDSLLRATTPLALDLEGIADSLNQTAHLIETARQSTTQSTDDLTARPTSSPT